MSYWDTYQLQQRQILHHLPKEQVDFITATKERWEFFFEVLLKLSVDNL